MLGKRSKDLAVVGLGMQFNVQELSPEDKEMIAEFVDYFVERKVEAIQAERVRELPEPQDKP